MIRNKKKRKTVSKELNINYKETKAPVRTVTYYKDIVESRTENIYEARSIISKRAVQINTDLKTELVEK